MCRAGARWVQETLEANSSAEIRVYAVWLPMLNGDERAAWDAGVLPDARVVHLWDEDRLAGRWFAENVEGYAGVAWDAYYLYGPDAEWSQTLGTPISTAAPVYPYRSSLLAVLDPLITP